MGLASRGATPMDLSDASLPFPALCTEVGSFSIRIGNLPNLKCNVLLPESSLGRGVQQADVSPGAPSKDSAKVVKRFFPS